MRVRAAQPTSGERRGDLRAVVFFTAFDLLIFGNDDAAGGGDMARNRLPLRFQAKAGSALLRCRYPVVGENEARDPRRATGARRGPAGHFKALTF